MIKGKAEQLFLGNFITMDDIKPTAEALTVKKGLIQYVGSKDIAESLCDEHTEVFDYSDQYIYPGFMESHCHPGLAGLRLVGEADLRDGRSMKDYMNIMKKYMEDNPDRKIYIGAGWFPMGDMEPHASLLDELSTDIPIIMQTGDGHSMLLNHKAMTMFGVDDAEYMKKMGPSLIRVDEEGKPTGYISEDPVLEIMSNIPRTVEDMQEYLLAWQDIAFEKGYTAVGNAGVELVSSNEVEAHYELEKEGRLKLRTYAWSCIKENTDTPEEDIKGILKKKEKYDGKYFSIIGAKVFLDGVIEAHTGWLLEEYIDEPGYYGVSRFNDLDKMTRLIKEAGEYGLSVHAHSIGDAASKFFADAVEAAVKENGNMDMRNAAAHLQVVRREDIKRFADLNIVAVCGNIWQSLDEYAAPQELSYIGENRFKEGYPSKSFIDAGTLTVAHTDFPVSPIFGIHFNMYEGCVGKEPGYGEESIRNKDELLNRYDMLKLMTINVAKMFHKENEMGSLSIGKIANMAVLNKDLVNCEDEELLDAKVNATFVDGKCVYKKQ